MTEQDVTTQDETGAPIELDPAQANYALQRLQEDENFSLAIVAGAAAAAIGAGAWTGITVVTEYQIGFMAVGVGFLVAYSIRIAGNGLTPKFQILGAGFSLLGCAAGNFFTVCYFIAQSEGMGFVELLTQLDPAAIPEIMVSTFSGMDLLFYAIAVYEGYRLSLRQVTQSELEGLAHPGSLGTGP
jgi:hypothetical protein